MGRILCRSEVRMHLINKVTVQRSGLRSRWNLIDRDGDGHHYHQTYWEQIKEYSEGYEGEILDLKCLEVKLRMWPWNGYGNRCHCK